MGAGPETSIYLWDLTTKQETILQGQSEEVVSLAFHPAGHMLATGARDGTLRVSVDTDGPRARLELHAEGGAPRREEAAPHLEAVRRLYSEAGAELSLDVSPAAPARLSLSFAHPR